MEKAFDTVENIIKGVSWEMCSPGTVSVKFQRRMNDVFGEDLDDCCLVFLDYVLIFSNSREAHYRDAYVICFHLAKPGLRLKWEKCRVKQLLLEYLRHVITRG